MFSKHASAVRARARRQHGARALTLAFTSLTALAATRAHAQHEHHAPTRADTTACMPAMPDMPEMAACPDTGRMIMRMRTPDPLGVSMDRMGSGTTWVPEAAPLPSVYFTAPGQWDVTGHAFAFAQYNRQGGARGDRQFGSVNWLMLMASRAVAGGRLQARTMLSLDAAGVGARGYPLLLQTGEAYDGEPLHDRQHPHDALMELSLLYERPITRTLGVSLYAAPSGEPALGPVAFMHRPSAMDLPTAPITHHWADATHIAFGVLSAGLFTNTWKLEASAFNGREPDQDRWDIDGLRLDSYSARLTVNPTAAWSASAGWGYLRSPEALEPDESVHRATAAVLHGRPIGRTGQWASTVVWGANRHGADARLAHALLAESEVVLDARHTVFARAERAEKSAHDLALDAGALGVDEDAPFAVHAVSLGYVRDVLRFARDGAGTLGLGAMATLNVVPRDLAAAYGSRTPAGMLLFLRARPYLSGMRMRGPVPMPAPR